MGTEIGPFDIPDYQRGLVPLRPEKAAEIGQMMNRDEFQETLASRGYFIPDLLAGVVDRSEEVGPEFTPLPGETWADLAHRIISTIMIPSGPESEWPRNQPGWVAPSP